MLDIISIGDATLDTFIEIDEATVTCSLNKEECSLCLNYADKIPIKGLQKKVAGNAANVAVGSARLGLSSAFWTILGDDDFARQVIKKMRQEQVSIKYVQKQKKSESNYTVVLNYQGERTQLIYRAPRDYNLPDNLEKSKYVYLTAMGDNHHKAYRELVNYLVKNRVKLAYNPGKNQIKCQHKICSELFAYTDIIFVNKEEAEMIVHGAPGEFHKGAKPMSKKRVKEILKELYNLGPEIVVVTDGVNGSYAFADNVYYYLPIFDGPLVERTGAGDSYATGFLAATIHGKTTSEAMLWGTFNSWSVVQKVGPQDGLLKLRRLKKLIKENPKFKPIII